MIKTPYTNAGSGLPAIEPLKDGLEGSPLSVTGTANTSVNKITSSAFYIMSNVPLHFRLSYDGSSATTNDPPIPANTPLVFACDENHRISVIKMIGAADGLAWIHLLSTSS